MPEIFRTPGYPLLLVPAVALEQLTVVGLLINFLLAGASGALVWLISTKLFPASKAAFWAAALYCFEPVGLLYSEKLMSETLFCTQFLLFVWLLIVFLENPTYRNLLLSAVALGWATYTRPVTLYLGLWLVPVLLFFPRRASLRQRVSRAILLPLIFGLTLTPWIIRNSRSTGYNGFSSVSDENLYFYSAAAVQARLEHKSFAQVQQNLGWNDSERYFESHPDQRTWSQGRIAQFERTQAERIIAHHLPVYSLIHARGCTIVLLDPGVTEILKVVRLYPESGGLLFRIADVGLFRAILQLLRQYPVAIVALVLLGAQLLVYYGLALAALCRMPLDLKVFLGWVSLYFVLVSGLPSAVGRFRTPIMPLVCIAAGAAVAKWGKRAISQLPLVEPQES